MPFFKSPFYTFSWPTCAYLEFYSFWTFWNHSAMFGFLDMKHYSSTQTFNSQWVEVPARFCRKNLWRFTRRACHTQLAHPTSLYNRYELLAYCGLQVSFLQGQGSIRSAFHSASPQPVKQGISFLKLSLLKTVISILLDLLYYHISLKAAYIS